MKKAILRVFFKPLTIINRIKKKDEKLIFFYSNLGFRDNVKAFYDYLIENNYNEQFKIVVSINDWEQYVKRAPKNVTFINNTVCPTSRTRFSMTCFLLFWKVSNKAVKKADGYKSLARHTS
jgi:CDP-glycerol glycerophosphotransferase (TagB/SpsB family)